MIGGGDVGVAVGRAVVPVRVGVHWGEGEVRNSQTVFIWFIFPSCNMGFKQNKPISVGPPDSLPLREARHPL